MTFFVFPTPSSRQKKWLLYYVHHNTTLLLHGSQPRCGRAHASSIHPSIHPYHTPYFLAIHPRTRFAYTARPHTKAPMRRCLFRTPPLRGTNRRNATLILCMYVLVSHGIGSALGQHGFWQKRLICTSVLLPLFLSPRVVGLRTYPSRSWSTHSKSCPLYSVVPSHDSTLGKHKI